MSSTVHDKLQVLVTGVDAAIAADVARLLAAEGAGVIAADEDAGRLARLRLDVGLCGDRVETVAVDLADAGQVRCWTAQLRADARLPQLMICCCASPVGQREALHGARPIVAGDVALSEHRGRNCPALAVQRVLQPPLFLHAEPLRRTAFDTAISVLRHPTLRGLLDRAPGRPESLLPYVAQRLSGAPGAAGQRLRLAPPYDAAPKRADAA